jgi:hypothetical protein
LGAGRIKAYGWALKDIKTDALDIKGWMYYLDYYHAPSGAGRSGT